MERDELNELYETAIPEKEKNRLEAKLRKIQEDALLEALKIARQRVEVEGGELQITDRDLNEVFEKFSNLIETVSEETIVKNIEKGKTWLLSMKRPSGVWGWWGYWLDPPELKEDRNFSKIWDTAIVLRSLIRNGLSSNSPDVIFGIEWLLKNRNSSGGWGRLPLNYAERFKCCLRPNTYETSCVLLTLLETKKRSPRASLVPDSVIYEVVKLLQDSQRETGDWSWELTQEEKRSANIHIAATSLALSALCRAEIAEESHIIKSINWLKSNQNPDGGWGPAPFSPSVTTKTCDALRALLVAGSRPEDDYIRKGINWLLENQGPQEAKGKGWGWSKFSENGRIMASNVENTAFAITALLRADFTYRFPSIQAALRWIISCRTEEAWLTDTPRVIMCLHECIKSLRG